MPSELVRKWPPLAANATPPALSPSPSPQSLISGSPVPGPESRHCIVKLTVTVMITGTAAPFSIVGVNCHCFTASTAA